MEQMNNEKQEILPALLLKYEQKIKATISGKYEILPEDLFLLPVEEGGVYVSKEEPDRFCCLVVGESTGFLYLWTARIENGQELTDFRIDIVS